MEDQFTEWMKKEGYANLPKDYKNLMHTAWMAGIVIGMKESAKIHKDTISMHTRTIRGIKKALDYALETMPDKMLDDIEMMKQITIFNSIHWMSTHEN